MNLFVELNKLPKQCIYGLINNTDKRIFLGYSTNIVTALGRLINYSNNLFKDDLDKLELIVIEPIKNSNDLRLKLKYWFKEYSNKGFLFYKKPINLPSYKLRIDLMADFRNVKEGNYLCYVKLISRRYRELTVGVFNTYGEAELFCKKYYINGQVNNIIYSNNKLSKEYLNGVR